MDYQGCPNANVPFQSSEIDAATEGVRPEVIYQH